ncbi:MAG: hypothetical protein KKF46_02345 [Nanoarchaeota archaeon]|nr:hypothetical protein [Nanoarchaeota archaeon]MBU1321172.1 hypothetical protein [Nanoarchaeota archaeon]MBU1598326.1 hypothetical protein [Nanoarchaeota archaeon]MBU2442288.1 hypothetical protein [Nanoarchaeota archaeon]
MTDLENKLKLVKQDIIDSLSQKEHYANDHMYYVFQKCKERGILEGEWDNDNITKAATISVNLDHKLSVHHLFGLRQNYMAMESTPLSDEAKQDLLDCTTLETGVKNYLKENFGEPVFKDEFEKAIDNYVAENTPDLDTTRRANLRGYLQATLYREMKVVERQDYEVNKLEEALKNV